MPTPQTVHVPPALSWLAPVHVDDLIRVGGPSDGGYVLPAMLLREAETLISMGLGHNWQFEREAKQRHPALAIHVYDHTVGARLYRREYLADLTSFLAGRGSWDRVQRRWRRLRDYRAFFPAEACHFPQRIHDRIERDAVDVATVFQRAPGHVFVKMDIEGAEYRVLEDVLAYADRILGFAIEFHDTGPLRPVFARAVQALLERYTLVHLHANNFTPCYRDGVPECMEITLARRDLVRGTDRRRELPIPLDAPNDPGRADYRLMFQ